MRIMLYNKKAFKTSHCVRCYGLRRKGREHT